MIPRRIVGSTHALGAPEAWKVETHGICSTLHVRCEYDRGLMTVQSAWEPTPDELAALNAGGSVVLSIVGGMPPVMLSVEPAVDEVSP